MARDLAGPASEASSLRPGDRLTCPPRRRWRARRSRGPRCAEEETLALGTPGKGGVSRKEDYLSGDAEPRRRLQTFPLKRKRRRRGERVGGGECQRREVVARGPGAGVLGRAQPEGERPGGPAAEVTATKPGRCPASLGSESCSPVAARFPPPLFPRAGGVERRGDACDFWGG